MKKILSILLVSFAATSSPYAQCDKPVTLTASKTEYLNADSTLQRSMVENSVVTFDKSSITVSSELDKTMTGVIHSSSCKWRIPYKEGQMVLKATFSDGGESKQVTITVTGKGGKITLLWKAEGKDRFIRVIADKFEEKTN